MATEEATKLNEMLRNIPDQAAGLDDNISQLQDIRDELQEQTDAVEVGLLDVSANRLKTFLDGKALALENGYTYRGIWELAQTYNVGETLVVAPDEPLIDSTSVNSTHYQCILTHTSTEANFPDGGPEAPTYWNVIPYNAVTYKATLKSGYNSTNLTAWSVQQLTFVIPPPPPILPGSFVWIDVYSLTVNWDSNTQVSNLISDWDYGYDLLTKDLDENGTYGLYAQISNVDTAINLLNINKNKLEGGQNVFPNYTP